MIGKTARAAAAVAAALVAAGALGGCTATADGAGRGALGPGSAGSASPAPVLTLPVVPVGAGGTVTAGSVTGGTGAGATPGNPAPTGGATATQSGVPQCKTVDLSPEANVVTDSAAAGHIAMNITVTNNSGHTCYIDGFPGLALEDKDQNPVATKVTWDPAVAKTMITLTNGQSASSSAHLDMDLPSGSEPQTGPCEPASHYLLITPPNNTTQLVAQIGDTGGTGITVCDSGALDVLAFVAGAVGPQQ
ncbi:MAG TPA: DUF4232 domain-containing protein [Actinocrinis sp.]|nr:DUF4232 domain-containing protein [Actinocrinis sp.]